MLINFDYRLPVLINFGKASWLAQPTLRPTIGVVSLVADPSLGAHNVAMILKCLPVIHI